MVNLHDKTLVHQLKESSSDTVLDWREVAREVHIVLLAQELYDEL